MFSALSVIDSLVRAGMRHLVVSPGSRSAPLTYALAALDQEKVVKTHVRIDERSAGFTALGLAKKTLEPVGIVTTSGTAVGELLPAVMEAYHSGLPLVLLTADRPERLRGTGSNQTTRQAGMFSNFVRAEVDLTSYPEETPGEQTRLLSQAISLVAGRSEQDWSAASLKARGPVHLNLAFDTPLTPDFSAAPLLKQWAQSLRGAQAPSLAHPDLAGEGQVPSNLPERKTVVVAGDGAGEVAQKFAQTLNLPLLAEPSSGARFSEVAIEAYREVLAGELGDRIDRVVLFGHPTLSRPIASLLADESKESAIFAPVQPSWFEEGRRRERAFTSLGELAEFAGRGSEAWLNSWQVAGAQRRAQLMEQVEKFRSDGEDLGRAAGMSLALEAWETALEEGEILLSGSSNLIRDLDAIAPSGQRAPEVLASRGLAGIDGTLSVAAGISLAGVDGVGGEPLPVRVLCGDLTFIHDAMSMNIGPLEEKPRVQVDVLDDRGGGIFATLEHGKLGTHPDFAATVNRFFTTPHAVDLENLAASFGADNGFSVRVVRVEPAVG